jgi:twitching motility protein PilJ
VIQEITTQTSAGTSATAQSIGNLAEMALDLRESVAGFKLPEEDVMTDSYSNAFTKQPAPSTAAYKSASASMELDTSLLDDDDVYPHPKHAKA